MLADLTPEQRADALLAQMTPTEKIAMMHAGAQCPWGACVDAIPRLGIPALKLGTDRPGSPTARPGSPSYQHRSPLRRPGTLR
jgi:hypothetical protein